MDAPSSEVKFKYVLNLTMDKYTLPNSNINIIHIPLVDDTTTDISKYFDDVTAFYLNVINETSPCWFIVLRE